MASRSPAVACRTSAPASVRAPLIPVPPGASDSEVSRPAADRTVWKGGQAMSHKLTVADWLLLGGLIVLISWIVVTEL